MKSSYISVMVLVLLSACSPFTEREVNDGFPISMRLEPQKIKVNEILKPNFLVVLDDYLVIQHEYDYSQDCFFVYTRDKMEFCYSFGRLGKSGVNNEFIAPRLFQNNSENTLAVFDQFSRKINYYQINKKEFSLVRQQEVKDNSKQPLQEMSFVNDSIIIFTTFEYELCSYNLLTASFIDKYRFNLELENDLGHQKKAFHFCNDERRIIVGFNLFNEIKIGKLNSDFTFSFDDKKVRNERLMERQEDFYDNILYYMFLSASKDYVYAQYMGVPFLDLQPIPLNFKPRNFNWLLEVYDWNKNKVAIIDFDQNLLRCIIDEQKRCIYAWDPLEDFEYLYIYDLSDILK
jgi:hypothetical protein